MLPADPAAALAGADGDCRFLTRVRLALSLLLLLQGIAAFFPGPLLWGINHLAYAPLWLKLLWPAAGVAILWSPLAGLAGRVAAERVAPRALGRRGLAYIVLPLAAMGLFTLFRVRTHFLGDGWLLGELVAAKVPFSGYEFIDYHLHARLFQWLGLAGEAQAYALFAALSILTGGLYVAVAAWATRALSEDPPERVLLFRLLLFCAAVQMFFGYVECYAILAVTLLVFLAQLVRYYRGAAGLLRPAVAFGAALFFHLDALFFAPLLLAAALFPPRRDNPAPAAEHAPERRRRATRDHGAAALVRRLMIAAAPPVAALVLGGIVYLVSGYDREWFETDFIGGRRLLQPLAGAGGSHGLLSPTRWKDVLSLLLLLCPVPLAVFAAAPRGRRAPLVAGSTASSAPAAAARAPSNATDRSLPAEIRALLFGCVWVVLLMSLVNFKLGTARDWDLFAAHSTVFVLAAVLLVWRLGRRMAGSRPGSANARHAVGGVLVAGAFFLTIPWFWVNAGEDRAHRRIRDVIADQPADVQAYAFEEIGKYLRGEDRIPEAIAAYERSTQLNPRHARVLSVLGALQYNSGDREHVAATFRRVLAVDSTFTLALETLARIHLERGDHGAALPYARRLANRAEETSAAAEVHGRAAEDAGLIDEAIEAFSRAYRLDPERLSLLERTGGLALLQQDYARAEQVFRAVLKREPLSISARVGLVIAIWSTLADEPQAGASPGQRERMLETLRVIEGLAAEGQASEQLLEWGAEIRQGLGVRPR